MSFCSLTKGATPNICWFCLVLINGVLLNLLCVWTFVPKLPVVHLHTPLLFLEVCSEVASCTSPYPSPVSRSLFRSCQLYISSPVSLSPSPTKEGQHSASHKPSAPAKSKPQNLTPPPQLFQRARVKRIRIKTGKKEAWQ